MPIELNWVLECICLQLFLILFLDTTDGIESKKRHVYAIVEGESPQSTPRFTPDIRKNKRLQKKLPKIFPRSPNLCNETINSKNSLGSDFDDKPSVDFHKVTLI